MDTYHIHITGIVQGVGFRPFVYQLATQHCLDGWVNNTNDGVHIEISATQDDAETFYRQIINHPPKLATITQHEIKKKVLKTFSQFEIIDSDADDSPSLPLTPDFAICEDCRDEISDGKNRRHNYAFATCTNCGPRYSIITYLMTGQILQWWISNNVMNVVPNIMTHLTADISHKPIHVQRVVSTC